MADLPKVNQCIQYQSHDSNDWKNAKVISRGGKVTGVNRFWLNIKNLDDELESCIDFENSVRDWRPLEYPVMFSSLRDDKFLEAKGKELANWKKFKVYEEVPDNGQKYISGRWVYSQKEVDGKMINKARLVCRGFEEDCEVPRDSPTCCKDTIRVGISVIASKQWEICSLDIKAAFLNGELDRDVFMKPPKEANTPGKLWKLCRAVYGLNDASRKWYFRLKAELVRFGCRVSNLDLGLFIYYHESVLYGIMMIHVDDILWAGYERFENDVIDKVRETFNISSECKSSFKYLGLEITHTSNGIYLSQRKYTAELQEIQIENQRKQSVNSPLTELEKTQLRSTIGKLNWLSTETRPDLAYTVSQLASSMKQPTIKSLVYANKIIKYVKQNDVDMFFPKLDLNDICVRCYADASFGTLENGGSQAGVFVEIASGDQISPVSWFSKRIKRVVTNTLAAETLAMSEAVDSAYYISGLLSEILFENKHQIMIEGFTDNYSLHQAAHTMTSVKDRRLRIELGHIRESITKKEFILKWVPTSSQLSDVLTKEGVDSSSLLSHITSSH